MTATSTSNYNLINQFGKIERQELEIKITKAVAIALGVTVLIYVFLLPLRNSTLGELIYQRGFTQHLVIFFTTIIGVILVQKVLKIKKEFRAFKKVVLFNSLDWENPASPQLYNYQQTLANQKSLIATRCSRILGVYINSGSRQTATEFAEEDSVFYNSASESSFTIPRTLVWAIPLLGFIGTVIGISQGVSGFSSFLEQAGDIEQIKQGIGTVTSGLAVAFDTTFLALLLSVLIMIPLVLVEQLEARLLLAVDMFINDQLLHCFKAPENLNTKAIKTAVNKAFESYLPEPKNLIQPAQEYAQQAASALAKGFVSEIEKVQNIHGNLIQEIAEINKMVMEDRNNFVESIKKQQETSQEIVTEIAKIVSGERENFVEAIKKQQQTNQGIVEEIAKIVSSERENFVQSIKQQQQSSQEIGTEIAKIVSSERENFVEAIKQQQQLSKEIGAEIAKIVIEERENFVKVIKQQEKTSKEIGTEIAKIVTEERENFVESIKQQQQSSKEIGAEISKIFVESSKQQQEISEKIGAEIAKIVSSERENFVEAIKQQQQISQEIVAQITKIVRAERENFIEAIKQQQQFSKEIVAEIAQTVGEINTKNTVATEGIAKQSEKFRQELAQATQALETRIAALTECTNKVAEIAQLQQSLDTSLQKLEKTGQLEKVLGELKDTLGNLQPALQQLNQPRRIMLVEQNNEGVANNEGVEKG